MTCGGCPGERLEHAPADMKKYGADVIYLVSCYLAGYPACPYIEDHKDYIENVVGLPVIIGTHPMPQNYVDTHTRLVAVPGERLSKGRFPGILFFHISCFISPLCAYAHYLFCDITHNYLNIVALHITLYDA